MRAQHSSPGFEPTDSVGLAQRYSSIRQASMALVDPLEAEDCQVQTIPEVSPTKWHLAHTTWFFEQFCLADRLPAYTVFAEQYAYLFNSYYYTVGEMHGRVARGLLNRPLLHEVLAYRRHVDDAMLELLAGRDGDAELTFLVTLGLHHEQQHQELMLTDIKHVFFTNPLHPVYRAGSIDRAADGPTHRFIDRPGGVFAIGHDGAGFCFDNETPRHDAIVAAHALGNRLVSNREYRAFIDDGGYREPRLWLADGWNLLQQRNWNRPLYWSDDLSREFTLRGWVAVDPNAPVCHVSYYEADAFARWADARLPSEAQWELAAAAAPVSGNTLESGALHPRAADGDGAASAQQLYGDVWEWTASPYAAYPGFRPLAGSLGEYNGKFMSNQMVVRGGSCATWASHLRSSYRSFFYPHDRWQFLGFRLAKDAT